MNGGEGYVREHSEKLAFSHYYTLYTAGVEMAPDKKELRGRIKRTLCK